MDQQNCFKEQWLIFVIFQNMFLYIISSSLIVFSWNKDCFSKVQYHEKSSSDALRPSFSQRSKLSMILVTILCWLSDIFTARLRLRQMSPVLFLMSPLLAFYQPSDNSITGGQTPSSVGLQYTEGAWKRSTACKWPSATFWRQRKAQTKRRVGSYS